MQPDQDSPLGTVPVVNHAQNFHKSMDSGFNTWGNTVSAVPFMPWDLIERHDAGGMVAGAWPLLGAPKMECERQQQDGGVRVKLYP